MFTLINNYRYGSVFDRVFNDVEDKYFPRNYEETNDGFEYEFNLAGFKKENVSATASNGEVYVSARQGDSNASFSFLVAEDADVEGVSANFEDGLLTVAVPKMASAQKINIEIK